MIWLNSKKGLSRSRVLIGSVRVTLHHPLSFVDKKISGCSPVYLKIVYHSFLFFCFAFLLDRASCTWVILEDVTVRHSNKSSQSILKNSRQCRLKRPAYLVWTELQLICIRSRRTTESKKIWFLSLFHLSAGVVFLADKATQKLSISFLTLVRSAFLLH